MSEARASVWKNRMLIVAALSLFGLFFAYVSDYNWSTGTGNLCLLLFLAASVYVPAKRMWKHYRFLDVHGHFRWLLDCHCWLSSATFIVAAIHCLVASWANKWLWLSLILMGTLTLNGFVMKFKYKPNVIAKGMFFLHTQQVVFFCLLYSMIKGHYVFRWLP